MKKHNSILIVDDDAGVRESLNDILETVGYRPHVASSGEEALKIIDASIDVALIDIRLGDMTGLEVMKKIKDKSPGTECILLTGYGTKESAIEAINLGAYSYLLKPYDLNNLRLTIQRAIEKRQTDEELQRSERKFRDLYHNSPDMYASISFSDQKILVCNNTLLRSTGFSSDEIIGQPVSSLYHDDCIEDVEKSYLLFQENGELKNKELILKTKDGGSIDVSLNIFPVVDEDDNVVQAMLSWRDITDLKQARQKQEEMRREIQQSQKMESIGTLAGGIAHDFNNILSSIIGFTELALSDAQKNSEQEDNLHEVHEAGLRAKELVEQILTFARKTDQKVGPIQPADIISSSLKLLRPSTPSNIDILPVVKSTSYIIGNESQFEQVIFNLCTNAIQSMMAKGGILRIDLRNVIIGKEDADLPDTEEKEYIQLTVSDNGPGIDSSLMQTIFEPYFTTKDVGEGSGMGLALVKGIIDSYGGHIEVQSEPGVNTQFRIFLPVTSSEDESDSLDDTSSSEDYSEHILLVDDEPSLIRLGTKILTNLGYTVTATTSSFEALELFKEDPKQFDLVVSDMTMPRLTGDELTRELKKIRYDTPVVLCTGYSSRIDEEKAASIGADGFIYKPYSNSKFVEVIRKVLRK